jgi:putative oxidoreductase
MTTIASTPSLSHSHSRAITALLWTAQIAAAAMFLFAGSLKLTGAPLMVQAFGMLGIGQWFRYVTGTIEVVSALLLLVPSLAFFGASALAVTMVGAVLAHVAVLGGNPTPAIVLFGVTAAIAWTRRPR